MKKGNIIKGVILGLTLCSSVLAIDNVGQNILTPQTSIHYVYADSSNVTISNSSLYKAICRNLGKNIGDQLKADDFKKAVDFIPDENGDIIKRCIDLSNSHITDIAELLQFELPDTIVAIDLSGNNINNEQLTKIKEVLSKNKSDSTYTHNKVNIPIRSDWGSQIIKINLNNNNIDLDSIQSSLESTDASEIKYIYGIQNLPNYPSKMYEYKDVENAKYFFRSNDHNYLSTRCSINTNLQSNYFQDNTITKLINSSDLGEYEIYIGNPSNTPTGYFNNVTPFQVFMKVFTIEVDSNFYIERNRIFNLSKNNIIINGLLGDIDLDIKHAVTDTIGTHDVNVIVKNIDTSRSVTLKYLVKDTIKPVITLSPNNTNIIYWRQNREFTDPGYRGTDSGDDITNRVHVDKASLDITKVGTYAIKYTLKDYAGNVADEVIRTVVVQEQVLDEITIRTSTENLIVGKEIVLNVEPSQNIDITKYKDFVYTWYLNGEAFKTTSGDKTTGKSRTVITLDNTNEVDITVELHAKQTIDNSDIYVSSERFTIKAELNNSDSTIVIAMIVALGIVGIVFISSLILKAKRKNNTSKKSKPNTPQQKNQNIQVIKNYPDNNNSDKK